MLSYFKKNLLKNSFGKVVFQILAKIEMSEIKIGYLAAILKQYIFFFFSFIFYLIYIVHTYMVQIALQNSGGKVVAPLGTNGSESTLVT